MNKLTKLALMLLVSAGCTSVQNEIGKPYKGWKEGEFDIHHIHTGMGEANFFIMPDGTSMLIDAGDLGRNDPAREIAKAFPPIAECEFHPGKYVANYVLRVNPNCEKVDYFVSSHFHTDHLCNPVTATLITAGRCPDYAITGVTEAGERLSFGKFYDRGYPDYDYPLPVESKEVMCFRNFVSWQVREKGAVQEQFKVGSLNQIFMTHEPDKYAGLFAIRNLAANGEVWAGEEEETVRYYDLNPENITGRQNENTKSIAIRMDYGPFSYYAGGDVTGRLKNEEGEYVNVEAKVGEACGEVDVCKTTTIPTRMP